MSLRSSPPPSVPDDARRIARAAFPRGSLLLSLRDELGPIFADQRFVPLSSALGQPAEAPWRLALVTLLQFMAGMSDRQAAEAVRGRIDWKYLLALPPTDAGCDSPVLGEFRARRIAGEAEQLLFDAMLGEINRTGRITKQGDGIVRVDPAQPRADRCEGAAELVDRLAAASAGFFHVHSRPPFNSAVSIRGSRQRSYRACGSDGRTLSWAPSV